jgi:serine/threonine-protein kinase
MVSLTEMTSPEGSVPMRIDRYELHDVIASGGMATVHLGRLLGPAGFGRTVAIKRLHPHLAKEPEFAAMLTDEARVASRIGHPNIVPVLDAVASRGELFLVMEYVPGLTLAELMKNAGSSGESVPVSIACAIMAGVLRGLDAAHEARDEGSRPLDVVHRDVSPQNILVGADGVARLLDFGIAKAVGRLHTTRDGELKGKVAYMAPEQLGARTVDRRTDIYAASVVLWEALTGERLFAGDDAATVFGNVMQKKVPPPSTKVANVPGEIDTAVLTGLEREPSRRFSRARDMATAIENGTRLARASEIADWVAQMGEKELADRAKSVAGIGRAGNAASASARAHDSTEAILTAVGDAMATPRPRRRTMWIAAGALLVVGAGGIVVVQRGGSPPAGAAALSETVAPAAATPAGDPSAAGAARLPEATEMSPAIPPASAKMPAAVHTNPASRVPGAKSRAAKALACDPPFTIDEQGHKHYKVDCL